MQSARMSEAEKGVVAAGHPLTAEAGAQVLREGGNAVDAAVAAMLTSFAAEPLLTGLGAGGYMMVAGGGQQPALLDFFVQAPQRATDGSAAELEAVDVSFGDAVQVFYIGAASCGIYGAPAGACEAIERWGTIELAELAAPAATLAREGVVLNKGQAYIAKILGDLLCSTPECAALWAPHGAVLGEGELLRNPELGDALLRLGQEGAEPFYSGDIADAVCAWLGERGGSLTAKQLGAYEAIEREPLPMRYRDREVLTNPPPSAGGTLLAYSLGLLDAQPSPPALEAVIGAMEAAQDERTAEFVQGLSDEDFGARFLSSRLGSTTHISVLDSSGACLLCDVHQWRGIGRGGPGNRHPLEQRDGRGGPQPARLPQPSGWATHAEHDGADDRDARGRGRAGARQRRLQPDPLGAAADDRGGCRSWSARTRGGERAARTFRAGNRLPRAGDRAGCRAGARVGRARSAPPAARGGALSRPQPVLRRRPGCAAPGLRS